MRYVVGVGGGGQAQASRYFEQLLIIIVAGASAVNGGIVWRRGARPHAEWGWS